MSSYVYPYSLFFFSSVSLSLSMFVAFFRLVRNHSVQIDRCQNTVGSRELSRRALYASDYPVNAIEPIEFRCGLAGHVHADILRISWFGGVHGLFTNTDPCAHFRSSQYFAFERQLAFVRTRGSSTDLAGQIQADASLTCPSCFGHGSVPLSMSSLSSHTQFWRSWL